MLIKAESVHVRFVPSLLRKWFGCTWRKATRASFCTTHSWRLGLKTLYTTLLLFTTVGWKSQEYVMVMIACISERGNQIEKDDISNSVAKKNVRLSVESCTLFRHSWLRDRKLSGMSCPEVTTYNALLPFSRPFYFHINATAPRKPNAYDFIEHYRGPNECQWFHWR